MTLGTIRIIFVINNKKVLAALASIIEILIWVLVVRSILNSDEIDFLNVFVYSLGYAIGTILGTLFEEKLGLGSLSMHILIDKHDEFVVNSLRDEGYGVAAFESTVQNTEKLLLMMQVNRKKIKDVKSTVHSLAPTASITVFNTRSVDNGYFKK